MASMPQEKTDAAPGKAGAAAEKDAEKAIAIAITPQNVAAARSKEKKNLQHLNEK